MKTYEYKEYQETYHEFLLHNRLPVHIIHKPNFAKTYVTLSTPLGANHRHYIEQDNTVQTVPSGIAHFLEHKIFEQDGFDISGEFSKTEASINAYTEYTRTTYLFHSTNHLIENTCRLINMFFFPNFTDKGIVNEKNIILEELNMHLDDPYYIQYQQIINNMYHNHPVKEDILGSPTSIQAIDYHALVAMHKAYYQPELSRLIIIGDVDPVQLKTDLESRVKLPSISLLKPYNVAYQETLDVVKANETMALDVLKPSVLIGIKLKPLTHLEPLKRINEQLSFSLLFDLMLGKNSDFYEHMMDSELINDSYGLDLTFESDYAFALISSETNQPDALNAALITLLKSIQDFTINIDDFNRLKRQMIGSFMQSLDSLEYVSHQMNRYLQDGLMLYDVVTMAQKITYEDVLKQRHQWIQFNQISTLIVNPKK